jgi:hypothetical protein
MKLIVGDIGNVELALEQLGNRENAKRIVQAGSAAAVAEMQKRTAEAHHIMTGEMQQAFAPGLYHEGIDKCWQDVYPQGTDSRGISNAKKAFITNYGRGGKRTAKTGDKFITGKTKTLQEAVGAAMRAEAERIKNEIMR